MQKWLVQKDFEQALRATPANHATSSAAREARDGVADARRGRQRNITAKAAAEQLLDLALGDY